MEHKNQPQPNTQISSSYAKKKQLFFGIVLLCIIVLIGGICFILITKRNNQKKLEQQKDPIETLTILKEISDPVVVTPKERTTTLQALSSKSKPVKSSEASRMAQLKMLTQ